MNVIDVKMECGSVDDQLLNSHAHGSFCQRPIVFLGRGGGGGSLIVKHVFSINDC